MTEGITYGDRHGYPAVRIADTERWVCVPVHRLLAVAKYGVEEVVGNDVHHKNGCSFDNRPGNIEVMSAEDHSRWHADQRWAESPWRDEETLRKLYHEEEMSLTEIGEELGCTLVTVHEWMKRSGISRRTPSEGQTVYKRDVNQLTLTDFGSG